MRFAATQPLAMWSNTGRAMCPDRPEAHTFGTTAAAAAAQTCANYRDIG